MSKITERWQLAMGPASENDGLQKLKNWTKREAVLFGNMLRHVVGTICIRTHLTEAETFPIAFCNHVDPTMLTPPSPSATRFWVEQGFQKRLKMTPKRPEYQRVATLDGFVCRRPPAPVLLAPNWDRCTPRVLALCPFPQSRCMGPHRQEKKQQAAFRAIETAGPRLKGSGPQLQVISAVLHTCGTLLRAQSVGKDVRRT